MTTVLAIKDKYVYYGGKVVGNVTDIRTEGDGIRCLIQITNPRLRRYLTADVSDLTLSV